MANTIAPFGLLAFGQLEGTAPTGGLTRAFIASSDTNSYFKGDTVKDSSVASLPNSNNYVVWDSSGFGLVRGVFYGAKFFNTNVSRVVWSSFLTPTTGSSLPDVEAYIIDNPQEYFYVQASSNAVMGSTIVGLNQGVVVVSSGGNTTDGHSVLSLCSSVTAGSTSSLPFRVMDIYSNYAPPGVNGNDLTTAGAIFVVRPNNWTRLNLTARTS